MKKGAGRGEGALAEPNSTALQRYVDGVVEVVSPALDKARGEGGRTLAVTPRFVGTVRAVSTFWLDALGCAILAVQCSLYRCI